MRPLRHPVRRDQGFTLVELLVVMIVIGVLAAIAVPTFLGQRQRARETAVKADLRTIAVEVHAAGLAGTSYPTARDLNAAGTLLRTSPTVRASVVWRTATDFCLAGTSSGAGPDPSGVAAQIGISTRVFVVSAARGATPVTRTDPGCLGAVPSGAQLSNANGYWAQDGYHDGALTG